MTVSVFGGGTFIDVFVNEGVLSADQIDFWAYEQGLAEFSVPTRKDLGPIGNEPYGTVGNMDEDGINAVADKLLAAEFNLEAALRLGDVATNDFIDDTIGF